MNRYREQIATITVRREPQEIGRVPANSKRCTALSNAAYDVLADVLMRTDVNIMLWRLGEEFCDVIPPAFLPLRSVSQTTTKKTQRR